MQRVQFICCRDANLYILFYCIICLFLNNIFSRTNCGILKFHFNFDFCQNYCRLHIFRYFTMLFLIIAVFRKKKMDSNSFTYFMIFSYFISDIFCVNALLPMKHKIWNDPPRWCRGSGLEYRFGDPGSIPDVPSPSAGPLKAMGLWTSGCLRRGRLGT